MLGIFAKVPGDEPVKTRLQPWLSPEQAEQVYLACVADTIETASQVIPNPVVFLSREPRSWSSLIQRLLEAGVPFATLNRLHWAIQKGMDLGERLENAFQSLHGPTEEPTASIVVGSDSPSLRSDLLVEGLKLLGTADLVLGPARDGGYYAIGMRRPRPGLLTGIPWSSSSTLEVTLERARRDGLRVATLEPWTDVDRPEDLEVLAEQIARHRAAGNSRTAQHSESTLRRLGLVDELMNWIGRS